MIGKMFSQLRFVVLTISMLLIHFVAKSQIEVSVPFDDGFLGLIGQNSQQATNIQRFSTLTVARAFLFKAQHLAVLKTKEMTLLEHLGYS